MDKEIQSHISRTATEQIALTAHDLRNIISGIYGLNSALSDKLNRQTDPEIHELTALISSQCELGIELTTGLVLAYQQHYFGISELLTDLQHIYQHKARYKNIVLTTKLPDKEIYIRTERAKLIRLLDNLLDNAVKFTPQQGRITIALIQQNSTAIITISDTGIGIPNSFHTVLFDKNPQTQRQGTENEPTEGLGLYICKQLADDLQAQLSFDSTENQGTTFYLSLNVFTD